MFMIILKNGAYFTSSAESMIDAIFDLETRGLISSSYEILSITELEH